MSITFQKRQKEMKRQENTIDWAYQSEIELDRP